MVSYTDSNSMWVSDKPCYCDNNGSVARMKFELHMKQGLQRQSSAHELRRALGVAESQARRVRQLQSKITRAGPAGWGQTRSCHHNEHLKQSRETDRNFYA
jgi:hypothetical protein